MDFGSECFMRCGVKWTSSAMKKNRVMLLKRNGDFGEKGELFIKNTGFSKADFAGQYTSGLATYICGTCWRASQSARSNWKAIEPFRVHNEVHIAFVYTHIMIVHVNILIYIYMYTIYDHYINLILFIFSI